MGSFCVYEDINNFTIFDYKKLNASIKKTNSQMRNAGDA